MERHHPQNLAMAQEQQGSFVPQVKPHWQSGELCRRKLMHLARRLQWCHTDLGANAFNFKRLMAEDKRFGALAQHSNGLTADHYDGVMAQSMLNTGTHKLLHQHACCVLAAACRNTVGGPHQQVLQHAGWKVRHVTDKCLFDHSPSPQVRWSAWQSIGTLDPCM